MLDWIGGARTRRVAVADDRWAGSGFGASRIPIRYHPLNSFQYGRESAHSAFRPRGWFTCKYDTRHRLTDVKQGVAMVADGYDGLNRWVEKGIDAGAT